MKKTINRVFIYSLFLLGVASSGFSQEIVLTKEFKSDNGKYTVSVAYEKEDGSGKAYYTIVNRREEVVGKFTSEMAPYKLSIADNGQNIVAFGGDWTEPVFIKKIHFYNQQGKLLKEYPAQFILPASMKIAHDKYYVLGYQYHDKRQLALFDLATGETIWDKSLDLNPDKIAVSLDAEWLVVCGWQPEKDTEEKAAYKMVLLDRTGKIYWEKADKLMRKKGGLSLTVEINDDGTMFVLIEKELRKNQETGQEEKYIYQEIIYQNNHGRATLNKVIKNISKKE